MSRDVVLDELEQALSARRRMRLQGLLHRYEANGEHCLIPAEHWAMLPEDELNYIALKATLPVKVDTTSKELFR